jgi:hypothetical protein
MIYKKGMNTLLRVALLCFALPCLAVAQGNLAVNARLVEVPADFALPLDLAKIAKLPSVDVLLFPKIVKASGETADFGVTSDFAVRGRSPVTLGMKYSLTSVVRDGQVNYSLDYERTEFKGYDKNSASQAPIFDTQKRLGVDGIVPIGKTAYLDLGEQTREQIVMVDGAPKTHTLVTRLILLFDFNWA